MRRVGLKFSEIEKETGVKVNTAGRIWSRRNNGYNCKSAPRNDRPPKLDENARENLRDYILKNRHTRREPLHDISNILNLHVHPDTIHKALVEMGLGHRIERKRPWLSPKQKEARLKLAQELVH